MVLRSHPPTSVLFVVLALGASVLIACVQPNERGTRPPADAAAEAAPDSRDPGPDAAPDAGVDRPAPGDTSVPPPDVMPTECTPRATGCSADGRSVRTCSDQGRWMDTATCAARRSCSGGLCLCAAEVCDEGPLFQTETPGVVGDMTGGGRFLFLAVNGPQSSIRRFDVLTPAETVVWKGRPEFTVYALDSDPLGNLSWCSAVHGASDTGQLMYGDGQLLDTGACSHVRRRDGLVYYQSDALHRRPADPAALGDTLTRTAMEKFEIAGDHVYFIGHTDKEAFLGRLPLADPTRVETLARRPDSLFLDMLVDATHVYVVADGQIFRIPQAGGAQLEMFWQEAGSEAWAMAQTDAHLYWSTTTPSPAGGCSEARVWRRPKMGESAGGSTSGPAEVLSKVQGFCAGDLVRLDDHLYTAIFVNPPGAAPTRVLRIGL
jgi:hypothetical protein